MVCGDPDSIKSVGLEVVMWVLGYVYRGVRELEQGWTVCKGCSREGN